MGIAQDPSELFDLYAEDGTPLGRTKPRALVHRDGDWHRSVQIWVVLRQAGSEELLFQRRSRAKDTWPGALDVAVTGHLSAGETVTDALREAREEIGLDLRPSDVIRIGLRRRVDDHAPGILDRELQEIFVAIVDMPLSAFRPDAAEIDALVAVPASAAGALFRGEVEEIHGKAPASISISLGDFVGAEDGYYARAHRAITAILEGTSVPAWDAE